MRPAALLLIVSLLINAAFVAGLKLTTGENLRAAQPASTVSGALGKKPAVARIADTSFDSLEKIWSRLDTRDWPILIAQLRHAGFPPAMIRAIVVTSTAEQTYAQSQQSKKTATQTGTGPQMSPDTFSAQGMVISWKLERERERLLTGLFGPQWKLDDDNFRIEIARDFGALPSEKIFRVHEIVTDFQIAAHEAIIPAQSKSGEYVIGLPDSFEDLKPDGVFSAGIVAQLKLIEAEKNDRLSALLTADEREEHELRTHPSAEQLQRDLGEFEPTEAEFRALLAARRDFEADFQSNADTSAAGQPAAEAQLQIRFAAALGSTRYAEYLQITDPASARLDRLATRLELPISVAMEITGLKRDALARANVVRNDPSLRPDDRATQLSALAGHATEETTTLLGARGLEAYRRNGGYWLDLISTSKGATDPVPPAPSH